MGIDRRLSMCWRATPSSRLSGPNGPRGFVDGLEELASLWAKGCWLLDHWMDRTAENHGGRTPRGSSPDGPPGARTCEKNSFRRGRWVAAPDAEWQPLQRRRGAQVRSRILRVSRRRTRRGVCSVEPTIGRRRRRRAYVIKNPRTFGVGVGSQDFRSSVGPRLRRRCGCGHAQTLAVDSICTPAATRVEESRFGAHRRRRIT